MASLPIAVGADLEAPSTRDRLVQAGLDAFSTQGFEGASLREIERSAGVSRGLVAHHFSTKDQLWRECVNWLMGKFHDELVVIQRHLADVSSAERAKVLLRVYVRFAARHPEYTRLLMLSGTDDSERVRWMVDTWIRPNFEFYNRMSRSDDGSAVDQAMKIYAFMGAASLLFTLPVESRLVFGVDVADDDFIERYADLLIDWVGFEPPTVETPRGTSALDRAVANAAGRAADRATRSRRELS